MKISNLIQELQEIQKESGDLDICIELLSIKDNGGIYDIHDIFETADGEACLQIID